jgi:hypothetical protein
MNCLECRELLQKRMDGETICAQTLEPHLSQCTTCREQYAAAQRLLAATKLLSHPKPAANFVQSMVAQVMQDRRQRQQKMRRRVFVTTALAALAASVLLMLLLAYYWLPPTGSNDPAPKPPITLQHPKKETPRPKLPDDAKETKKQEPRNAVTAWTNRLADTTRAHAKVVLVAADLDSVDRLPAVNDLPMNSGMREAGQEVSDGVLTVTRNARKALDFFARELPMPELEDQKN